MTAPTKFPRLRVLGLGPAVTIGALAYALSAFAPKAAVAQPSGQTGTAGTTAGAAGAAPAGQVGFQHTATLSPQEQVKQSGILIARIEAGAIGIAKQLGMAREAHDVVKTLFLNDKLSQIDVALRSARERKDSLAAAAASGDTELAAHEFQILVMLEQRAEQLVAESNQAVGEDMAFTGETSTSEVIDPSIPVDGDPTALPPTDPTLISGPPLPTSGQK